MEQTGHHMENFAVDGLRTLCVAEREIENVYYEVTAVGGVLLVMVAAAAAVVFETVVRKYMV
jgi:preprotein translocase subunit SecY